MTRGLRRLSVFLEGMGTSPQLPTHSDSRYGDANAHQRGERVASERPPFTLGVSDPRGTRFNFLDYVHQIARAADIAGFDGVQIENNPQGDESWIVAGYVARSTRHLKLLTEFDAARGSAVYAAKNAVSYQRFSGGRFAWQISAVNDAKQRRQFGDFVADADILPRIEEFIVVARGVLTESVFNFKGRFFEVLNGGFKGPLANHSIPIYLSGDDEAAYRLSAKQADVHIFSARPAAALQGEIAALNHFAQQHNRTLAAALRIDVLARETEVEALRDARRYLDQSGAIRTGGDPVIAANLWNRFATASTGANAALVGSYEQVIERLLEYVDGGVSSFLLAGVPHLEEAYRIGEYVLPTLRTRIAARQTQAA